MLPWMNRTLNGSTLLLEAGAEVVEDDDVGFCVEVFDDMAADESCTAGDENGHGWLLSHANVENNSRRCNDAGTFRLPAPLYILNSKYIN